MIRLAISQNWNQNMKKTTREISILKDLVIKLEQKVEFQTNQIIDLKTKSMECNTIITGLNENQNENLPLLVQTFFMHDLEMQESEVNNVGIIKLYRQGDPKTNRKIPRPVFIQFANLHQKEKNHDKNSKVKRKKIASENFQSLSRRNERTQKAPVRSPTQL